MLDVSTTRIKGLHGKQLLYFTSIFVSLGVFLFGYDQGVMSGIITGPYFIDYFNQPSSTVIGTMVAILEVGALISSLCAGKIGDLIGRKKTIRYGALIFLIGGLFQTLSTSMNLLVFGRIISGLGVGLLSTIVPVFQSEISPPHNRGKLACIEFTGNIFGYATSVWVDYFSSFINSHLSWRIPLFIQCICSLLLFFGSYIICESPRWLLDTDRDEDGIVVIARLQGDGDIENENAKEEYRNIKETIIIQRLEGERTYAYMWKRYKKRLMIAVSSQVLAQLNGINVISYYAPLVFEQAGWVGRDAILMTGVNSLVYLASTVVPWYLVDRWGRRVILLSGAIVMAISLSLISYFMFLNIHSTPTLVVIFVVIYNAFFGYSWGPIPWLFPSEIMPLSVRAKGASLATAGNWAFNWVVGEQTPILQDIIGWRLYLIHAFFCILSAIVVFLFYPETKGVHLEDMDSIFDDRSISGATIRSYSSRRRLNGDNQSVFSGGTREEEGLYTQPSPAALARTPNLTYSPTFPPYRSPSLSEGMSNSFVNPCDIEPPEIDLDEYIEAHSLRNQVKKRTSKVGRFVDKLVGFNQLERSTKDIRGTLVPIRSHSYNSTSVSSRENSE